MAGVTGCPQLELEEKEGAKVTENNEDVESKEDNEETPEESSDKETLFHPTIPCETEGCKNKVHDYDVRGKLTSSRCGSAKCSIIFCEDHSLVNQGDFHCCFKRRNDIIKDSILIIL